MLQNVSLFTWYLPFAYIKLTTSLPFFPLQNRVAVMDDQCVSHSSPQRNGGQASTEIQRQGRPSVIRCGWLRKQGGFVKTWHSRWFVLRGDQLYYYKDEEETKALVRPQIHRNAKARQIQHISQIVHKGFITLQWQKNDQTAIKSCRNFHNGTCISTSTMNIVINI